MTDGEREPLSCRDKKRGECDNVDVSSCLDERDTYTCLSSTSDKPPVSPKGEDYASLTIFVSHVRNPI